MPTTNRSRLAGSSPWLMPPTSFNPGCRYPQGAWQGIGWPAGRNRLKSAGGEDCMEQEFGAMTGRAAFATRE